MLSSYLELIQYNRQFRYLWLSQVVSLFGDWFSLIASAALIAKLSESSGLAISGLFIARMLPPFILGPFAGVVADRFNRRHVLIVTDLLRVIIVTNFVLLSLGVFDLSVKNQLGLIYLLTVAHLAISTFFEPAHAALLPSLVKPTDLLTANAIRGITWSVMMAVGSAIGGLTTAWFGPTVAFVLDVLSFLLSAWLTLQIILPNLTDAQLVENSHDGVNGWQTFIDGLQYLWQHPPILAVALLKAAAAISYGGLDVIQVTLAEKHFPLGHDGSATLGLIYVAIGLGTGFGPLIARHITGDNPRAMYWAILFSFAMSTTGYFMVSAASNLAMLLIATFCRTLGSGINWVYSSSLLQITVPHKFLGRVFAFDLAIMTLASSASILGTGWAQDSLAQSPSQITLVLASLSLLMSIIWLVYLAYQLRQPQPSWS